MSLKLTLALGVILTFPGCDKPVEFAIGDELKPRTLEEALALSDEELERVDLGRLNLICARDADGTDRIDVELLTEELDRWAETARAAERRYRSSYERDPGRYDNSYAKFRAVNLALTVKEDFQCRYRKSLIASGAMDDVRSPRFFRNPDDVFIFGLLLNRRGTCSSFPVLLVALGRRLGYPLYLKLARGHLFCCWDDGVERFNLDTNGDAVDTPTDEHYLSDPRYGLKGLGRRTLQDDRLMVRLDNREAFSVFLETEGYSLEANGDISRAQDRYRLALRGRPRASHLRRLSARRKDCVSRRR